MKIKEQKEYEAPQTTCLEVELEQGFMSASMFDKEDGHDQGLTIEEHGFASGDEWEGDYTEIGWDK